MSALIERFTRCLSDIDQPVVMETGAKRSIATRSTLHREWVPNAHVFLGTDIEEGIDVDFVADLHCLTDVTGVEVYDGIITCSTLEHVKYPFKASHELMKALKVGGCIFVHTHQTFPLHAYPYDYFRFSQEALRALFGKQMGMGLIETAYEFPAQIHSKENPGGENHPAWLNVLLFAVKIKETPEEFIFEYDNAVQ